MSFSRRRFLQAGAAAASAAAVGPVEWVFAQEEKQSKSPGERLGFAHVGVNGRGGDHIGGILERDDTEILYICDVDDRVGQGRADEIAKKQDRRPQVVRDFRKALEDPAVDCVTTATPNHWHSLVAIWSMQAGKDVYVEKPVSHNVWEGRQAVNWARHLGRICQAGTQSRSSPSLKEAAAWVQAGNLGQIKYAIGTCYKPRQSIGKLDQPLVIPESIDYDLWCGPAAKVDLYRPRLHYDWHWDWNTGNGDMGNQGIHQMDIARWFLGEQELSPRILSIGGRLGYDDAGNTPNTQVVIHEYAKAPLIFETRGLPKDKASQGDGLWGKNMDNYRGSQIGVIVQCEQGYIVVGSYSGCTAFDNDGKEIQTWRGGGNHYGNFVAGVRSRKHEDLNADILNGHLSSALCHTGGVSHVLGKKATSAEVEAAIGSNVLLADSYDRMAAHLRANEVDIDQAVLSLGPWLEMDPATETFKGNEQASALLTRPYRDQYVVPECPATA
jgi:predicted dehydrogenase